MVVDGGKASPLNKTQISKLEETHHPAAIDEEFHEIVSEFNPTDMGVDEVPTKENMVFWGGGRYSDDDFDFYGRYGTKSDGTRERYVDQQEVIDGLRPDGYRATQQPVIGYIGDEFIHQESVKRGYTPDGELANQSAVQGFLTKEPSPDLDGISIPEIEMRLFGKEAPRHPRIPIGAPRMPGQRRRRRKK